MKMLKATVAKKINKAEEASTKSKELAASMPALGVCMWVCVRVRARACIFVWVCACLRVCVCACA